MIYLFIENCFSSYKFDQSYGNFTCTLFTWLQSISNAPIVDADLFRGMCTFGSVEARYICYTLKVPFKYAIDHKRPAPPGWVSSSN